MNKIFETLHQRKQMDLKYLFMKTTVQDLYTLKD